MVQFCWREALEILSFSVLIMFILKIFSVLLLIFITAALPVHSCVFHMVTVLGLLEKF